MNREQEELARYDALTRWLVITQGDYELLCKRARHRRYDNERRIRYENKRERLSLYGTALSLPR